jgi:hypothetical protein
VEEQEQEEDDVSTTTTEAAAGLNFVNEPLQYIEYGKDDTGLC